MTSALDLEFVPGKYPAYAYKFSYYMETYGLSKAEAKRVVKRVMEERVWFSQTHQVAMNPFESPSLGQGQWLSIKTRGRDVIDDRQSLARIMRAMAPGYSGFEILPAPSRLVDTANQYHIWAFKRERLKAIQDVEPPAVDSTTSWQAPWFPPPHAVTVVRLPQQDWRDLYLEKERRWPGQEAALYWDAEPSRGVDGCVLVLPRKGAQVAFFPFGFNDKLLFDKDSWPQDGSRQRDLPPELKTLYQKEKTLK